MPTQQRRLNVFLSYASEDESAARELYAGLSTQNWIDPWDKTEILPGRDWRSAIEEAVEKADAIIICLSNHSVNAEGFSQRELRYAAEKALEKPEGTIFLIPLRLDSCPIPRSLASLQPVDYFGPRKKRQYSRLLEALRLRHNQYREKVVPSAGASGSLEEGVSSAEESPQGQEEPKKASSRKWDSAIIAAVIGVAGTLLAALIGIYANRPPLAPTATQTIAFTATAPDTAVPTGTFSAVPPTLTAAPTTETPSPTVTYTATVIPPALLGGDWLAGCISTLWIPYPREVVATERGDGCWKEPLHVFKAENGDLDFLAQRRNAPPEVYGLFAALPENGHVTFTVRMRDLSNVDIWMGIFPEPDIRSEGLLMIVPAGNVQKRPIVHKELPSYETLADTIVLDQGNGYSISFRFTTNSAMGLVNPSVFSTPSMSIPTSQKWLFLGYRGLGGSYRVDATFLSFTLAE